MYSIHSWGHVNHIILAVIVNVLLLAGTGIGVSCIAPSATYGTASVGFQGTGENGVSHIYLTITEITLQGGVNTTNSVYLSGPVQFDLLTLVNVTRMLGDVKVAPGHYNMIRFTVVGAIATISGQNVSLKLPSGEVKVPIQFDVTHGQTTTIILTISANNTLIVKNHILRPVVTGIVGMP